MGAPKFEDRVRKLASELESLREQDRLGAVYRAGELVAEALFGGEPSARQSRRRGKGDSLFRKLEDYPDLDLPISRAELYRAVRVYELCRRVPSVLTSKVLTLSHVVAVLSVPPEQQAELLEQADNFEWKVRDLHRAVEKSGAPPAVTGRPRTPTVLKTLGRALAPRDAFEGIDALLGLERQVARELLDVCRRAQTELKRAEKALELAASDRPKVRLLIVDASKAFALRAQQQLRQFGYAVRVARSCAEATECLDPLVRCVIIDLFLPDGNGTELARQLERDHPHIPYIFVTSRQRPTLSAELQNVTPLVYKGSSGLLPLRAALANTLTGAERKSV